MKSGTPDHPDDEPARPRAATGAGGARRKRFSLGALPLMATIAIHAVLVAGAGFLVVREFSGEQKRVLQASARDESAQKVVEHRLQVARRGSTSGGMTTQAVANRIQSVGAGAVSLPELSELPATPGFGGFGSGFGVGSGTGTGMSTSLGNGTIGTGRGFMSLSFLGMTNQSFQRVVFVLDTSNEIMEPRKGGFRAFEILREEVMRLVARLGPAMEFNVVLFRHNSGDELNRIETNLFSREPMAATMENKKVFFEWMQPVNARLGAFGPASAGARTAWRPRPLPEEVDPLFLPPVWARAVQAALEQKPDVIYVVTATQGVPRMRVAEAVVEKRREELARRRAAFEREMAQEGLDANEVVAARDRALARAERELGEINRRLEAQGRDPIVLRWIGELERADVQAALRSAGTALRFDGTGWSRRDGSRVAVPYFSLSAVETASWTDFFAYHARVTNALSAKRPVLNIFFFVGPNERPEDPIRNLTAAAKRNGGSFQLLTTQRLEEIRAKEQPAAR